jgi:hypothetical protein
VCTNKLGKKGQASKGLLDLVSSMSAGPPPSPPRPVSAGEVIQAKGTTDASLGGTGLLKVVRGLQFDSTFDSANLRDVTHNAATGEFELFVASDCHGTPYQTRNMTWFYFIVRGAKAGDALSFRIMNMNRQPGLYTQVSSEKVAAALRCEATAFSLPRWRWSGRCGLTGWLMI